MTEDTMIDEIFEKFDGAFAENTIRAYRSDFEQYSKWCTNTGIPPIPATAYNLALYVDDLSSTCKSATIRRRVNSLGTIFKLSRNPNPTKDPEVVLAIKRMHRRIGRQQKQATPLTKEHLAKLLSSCSDDIRGLRNRVLLQLGYETMRRRSEICAFKFEDLTRSPGLESAITLTKSKTDQEGISKLLPISKSLANNIKIWKKRAQIDGFILRSVDQHGNVGNKLNPGSVSTIINDLAQNTEHKLDGHRFTGHSFRIGGALDLLLSGATLEIIMVRGGWQSTDSAMRYLRSWESTLR